MEVKSLSMSSYSAFLFTFDCSSSFSKSLSSSKRCIYDIFLISTYGILDQFLYNPCLFPHRTLFPIEPSPHIPIKALIPSTYINAHKGRIHLWSNTSVPPIISVSYLIFISRSVIRKLGFNKLNVCIGGRKEIVSKDFPTLVMNGKELVVLGSQDRKSVV